LEAVDFRNNVIYNWGSNSGYAGEGGSYNMVNNYYKPGPATKSGVKTRIFAPGVDNGTNTQAAGVWGMFYVAGNYMYGSTAVTADNWLGIFPDPSTKSKTELKSDVEFAKGTIVTNTATEAYDLVLAHAGASMARDTVDKRIVYEVKNGTFTYTGSNGSTNGLIDTQTDVEAWPTYASGIAPTDNDHDGMADNWETLHGLNPADTTDRNADADVDGYTNLEEYLNSIADGSVVTGIETIEVTTDEFVDIFPNPITENSVIQIKTVVSSKVLVQIIDVEGRIVSTLFNTVLRAGINKIDIKQSKGNSLKSGVYFVTIQVNSKVVVKKIVVL
jgi:hypothetical protein